ncbi:MAG: energy transducer TonB [Candidatus Accumulibacter sp.]|jgi:protein TonB|nr:energy transducer TonB [Accumulibacter sp.]
MNRTPAAAARNSLSFAKALLLSLAAHGILVAAWTGYRLFSFAAPPPADVLVMELSGLITERQLEERRAAPPEPEPAPAPEPEPEPENVQEPEPEPESVPLVRKPPRPKPEPRPRPVPPAPPPEPLVEPSQDTLEQERQTISRRELEASLLRQYLAQLSKVVQGHLVYPVEALVKGWTGSVVVGFTISESGEVVPGSASVHSGSGHTSLDKAALRAVNASADLPKPSRRMDVSISINFRQDKRENR